ncbi:MAG: FHA domain-containing protein, partial [Myxococcales bacterium]|nr:FHA domain-containing protein [Myxococcales bacterium]
MKQLRQLTGRGAGRRLTAEGLSPGDSVIIGREAPADFVIDEEHISSQHLKLTLLSSGALLAEDLKSTNGTMVVRAGEELKLSKARKFTLELSDGDVIHLGDPEQPVHMRYADGLIDETTTKQEILAVAHLTGVHQFEDRIRQDPERISVLYGITKRLSGNLDPAETGRVACEGVFELLKNATHVVISLENAPTDEFIYFSGQDRDGHPIPGERVSKSLIDQVRRNKAGMLLSDATSELNPAVSIVRLGIRTILAAPLWIGDRVSGVIQADNRASGTVFTEADLEALTVLAGQVSLAIENARLFSRLRAAEARLEEENKFLKKEEERRY